MNTFGCIGTSIVNTVLLFGIVSTDVPSSVISGDGPISGWLHIREPGGHRVTFNRQCIIDEPILRSYSAPQILEVKPTRYEEIYRYYQPCWLIDSKGRTREIWVESALAAEDMRFGNNYLIIGERFRVANPVPYLAGE